METVPLPDVLLIAASLWFIAIDAFKKDHIPLSNFMSMAAAMALSKAFFEIVEMDEESICSFRDTVAVAVAVDVVIGITTIDFYCMILSRQLVLQLSSSFRGATTAAVRSAKTSTYLISIRSSINIIAITAVTYFVLQSNSAMIDWVVHHTATTICCTTTITSTTNSACSKLFSVVMSFSLSAACLYCGQRNSQDDDDDDDDNDLDMAETASIDDETLDAIVDHPYLNLKYPGVKWTLRKVRYYERKTIRKILDPLDLLQLSRDGIKNRYEDMCREYPNNAAKTTRAVNGELAYFEDVYFELAVNEGINAVPLSDDVAVLDQLEKIHLDSRYFSAIPSSIRYLTKLQHIVMLGYDGGDFTIASDYLSNLHVQILDLEGCTGRTVVEFFDLPSVQKIELRWHGRYQDDERYEMDQFISSMYNGAVAAYEGSETNFRPCKFATVLSSIRIYSSSLTTQQLCQIIGKLPKVFPKLTEIVLVRNKIRKPELDGLVAYLKEELKNEGSTDNSTSLLLSRLGNLEKLRMTHNPFTRSTNGLQSFLNLLELNVFRHVTWVGNRIGNTRNDKFAQQLRRYSFRKIQMNIVNILHQNSVGWVLTRQPRYGNDLSAILPLSVWAKVVHRASTKCPLYSKCGVNFQFVTKKRNPDLVRLRKDEKSEEEKEWKATSIFF